MAELGLLADRGLNRRLIHIRYDLQQRTMPYSVCGVGSPIAYTGHITVGLKVKVQVYSLISSLETYHPTFTPWSLDLLICVPFQLHGEHTVLQPFRHIKLIVCLHIVISILAGTHFHPSQVKRLRVKCLSQGHNIETMSRDVFHKLDYVSRHP